MTDPTRRRRYRDDRIVIESARILSPQFDDAVLYFTGAQIEMLRNVAGYLRRLETYVVSYHSGYYLTPTAEDYDDLIDIVSDLEETLMGNQNTLWGYNDTFILRENHTKSGDGDKTLYAFTVPAGYVYVINVAASRNADTAVNQAHYLYVGGYTVDLAMFDAQPADVYAVNPNMSYVLKEGDKYRVDFFSCLNGDALRIRTAGYKMKVPE